MDPSKTQGFSYDPQMDYLASSTGPGAGSWTVDAAGNRSNSGYSYDALNRMTASPFGAYQHDAAGNRTWEDHGSQTAAVKHTWDPLNRMTALQGVSAGASYRYRADGMRVSKREGITLGVEVTEETVSGYYDVYATDRPTTRYYHDGQSGYEEDYTRKVSGTDTVDVVRYGLGPRGIESQRVWSGSVGSALPQTALGFPVYDTHGNNVGMVALTGTVAHERTYSPWGEVLSSNGSPPQQGYCANLGHRQDAESSLTYMRARYYEPTTGRFLTEDPARDGTNWYVYCNNEPVCKADFSGRVKFEINGYTFRLDWDIDQQFGDLHVWYKNTLVYSSFGDGRPHHSAAALSDDIIKTLVAAAQSGHKGALHLVRMIGQGWFGVSAERLAKFTGNAAKGLFAIGAISSLDAYARYDIFDFADTLWTIAMLGKT